MHAWIGFIFSCAMIVAAAMTKSGNLTLPEQIGGSASMEFMFFLGCAGFSAALAMIAPSHSSARLASMWSAGALGIVVVALNMNSLTGKPGAERNVEPAPAVLSKPEKEEKTEDAAVEPVVKFELKRTITDKDWAPFQDIDYRIRQMEREAPPQPENSEANPANIPPQ